jgi:hypothetical protein
VLNEKLYFFPDLNQTGEYRATFNLGTVTKLSNWLTRTSHRRYSKRPSLLA